jgi:hypothetical protein
MSFLRGIFSEIFFLNRLMKLNLFLLLIGGGNVHGMDLVKGKNSRSAQEKFMNLSFGMVYNLTHIKYKLSDDATKKLQEAINDPHIKQLFLVATLPPEIQGRIIALFLTEPLLPDLQGRMRFMFCEKKQEELAQESLKFRIGDALHDCKWACGVMMGRNQLQLRDVINININPGQQHVDTIFTDEKKVFSLAKQIQQYEGAYKQDFVDLSARSLQGIQTIFDTCSWLENYLGTRLANCIIRKEITWKRFRKQFNKDLFKGDKGRFNLLFHLPFVIKASSRLIELFFCTRIIKEEIVNSNRIAQAVNAHLQLSDDPCVRGYSVPFASSVQDYSSFDYLKMYSPYLLSVLYTGIVRILGLPEVPNLIKAQCLGSCFWAGRVACYMDREFALGFLKMAIPILMPVFVLRTILYLHYQKKLKIIRLNQIPDLLKRTDIEILS